MYHWGTAIFWVSFTFSLLIPLDANSKTLFGVVSERSAAELAAGAQRFSQAHPQHTLVFRTTAQIRGMSDEAIVAEIKKADALLFLAIFGDTSKRLEKFIQAEGKHHPLLAINSDYRLVGLSRNQKGALFQGWTMEKLKKINRPIGKSETLLRWRDNLTNAYPHQTHWITGKAFWQSRGQRNVKNLISLALQPVDEVLHLDALQPRPPIRFLIEDTIVSFDTIQLNRTQPWLAIIDHHTGDRMGDQALINLICQEAKALNIQCVTAFAQWGSSSVRALEFFQKLTAQAPLAAVINLQDFVVGGGSGRQDATDVFAELNVPILKGLRVIERSEDSWKRSEDGLPWESIHYRIAMPELQGVSQPHVLATAAPSRIDPLTGLEVNVTRPHESDVHQILLRVKNWYQLRVMPNHQKKVALIYYNHPPGRHNIGADNLNVPVSIWEILRALKAEGYHTGPLPTTPEDLLQRIQEKGVNLPEDHQALAEMAPKVQTISRNQYEEWIRVLPEALKKEMSDGPLGFLHVQLKHAIHTKEPEIAERVLNRIVSDITHVVQGADHPAKTRALDLLRQLNDLYHRFLNTGTGKWTEAEKLFHALQQTGIEGIKGWGAAPGTVMVHNQNMLIPGLQFGNIFIGPQPPRGWELNEELLHANMSFPPTHQYLAFYFWLQHEFGAHAMIHLGRHSTYEFLPRHGSGVGDHDYSYWIAGAIPGLYPYIVDGVGEGIQAKRRGLAVIIDHLTPPLRTTPLYDEFLELRQLIESYEASSSQHRLKDQTRAINAIRLKIDALHLRAELEESMADELRVRGISFEQADGDFLVHEVGHYLTTLQEKFMPLGLHSFGKDWEEPAVALMAESMSEDNPENRERHAGLLRSSPKAELQSLLNGLNGEYVAPGKGNDPIRTAESLPTGKNFFALDGSLLPTRLGYELGVELAQRARQEQPAGEGKEAVILWASDTVRDEGAMIAFGLDMLGISPTWNSRGILTGITRLPLTDNRQRLDMMFVTSGLFRDLYGQQLVWLDKAVLLALDGAANSIRKQYPSLGPAITKTLAPLGTLSNPGNEPIQDNLVAKHWIDEALELSAQGHDDHHISQMASLRIFGTAPGAYGAGVNRLAERSGSWERREELAETYIARMGHTYGTRHQGTSVQDVFRKNLKNVDNLYLGRASNLYGLLDNNDAFDYLGGLSLAVEMETGASPQSYVIEHAASKKTKMQKLDVALLQELRGRFLNPAWLNPLMEEGYSGARTMGSEFLEYLWGWQVTSPEIVKSWVWDEVKAVYLEDKLGLGLDQFLEKEAHIHVKSNMLAIMLIAAQRGFWLTDPDTIRELSRQLADLLIANGLPGSGHTTPDHPVFNWIKPHLTPEQVQKLERLIQEAKGPIDSHPENVITTISEIQAITADKPVQSEVEDAMAGSEQNQTERDEGFSLIKNPPLIAGIIFIIVTIFCLGVFRGSLQQLSRKDSL